MTILTKYNKGDELWFIHDNKVKSGTVSKVVAEFRSEIHGAENKTEDRLRVWYCFQFGINLIPEEMCFVGKKELILSLEY